LEEADRNLNLKLDFASTLLVPPFKSHLTSVELKRERENPWSGMGAGGSTQEQVLPDILDEQSVRDIAGDQFDAVRFKALANDGKITKEQLLQVSTDQGGERATQLFALESVQIYSLQPPMQPRELTQGVLRILSVKAEGVEYILLQLGDSFLYPLAGQEVVLCEDQTLSLVLPDFDLGITSNDENEERFLGLAPSDGGSAWEELISLVERECTLSRSSDSGDSATAARTTDGADSASSSRDTFHAADAVAHGVEASSRMVAGAVLYSANGIAAGMVTASKYVTEVSPVYESRRRVHYGGESCV
jgi:hypothetical protein